LLVKQGAIINQYERQASSATFHHGHTKPKTLSKNLSTIFFSMFSVGQWQVVKALLNDNTLQNLGFTNTKITTATSGIRNELLQFLETAPYQSCSPTEIKNPSMVELPTWADFLW